MVIERIGSFRPDSLDILHRIHVRSSYL
jgi:hypothetical protein